MFVFNISKNESSKMKPVRFEKKRKLSTKNKSNKSNKLNKSKKIKSKTQKNIILKNTRNENCNKNNMTSCCPHMNVDTKGRYMATNEKTILNYNGKKYQLYTCCKMCSLSMNEISKNNRNKFARLYINGFDENGNMLLMNQHTKKVVQLAKLL